MGCYRGRKLVMRFLRVNAFAIGTVLSTMHPAEAKRIPIKSQGERMDGYFYF